MTEPDDLSRALLSLRDAWDGSAPAGSPSRMRILARAREQQRRRRRIISVLIPIAAVLAASVAWAAITGRLAAWFGTNAHHTQADRIAKPKLVHPDVKPPANATPEEEAAPTNEKPEAAATQAIPNEPSSVSPPPNASSRPIQKAQRSPSPPSSSSSAQNETSPVSKREQELYNTAHEAHFAAKNSKLALANWNAYLAEYPAGRFALEARYNRAISLVRLGRTSEAKKALEPFAHGAFGSYRQREAQELLAALEAADGGSSREQ